MMMSRTIIVISSDEEDGVEKPASRMNPRRTSSQHSQKPKPETTTHHRSNNLINNQTTTITPFYSLATSQPQASVARSKTVDIPSLSNADHGEAIKRPVSVPSLDYTWQGKSTQSVESHFKNMKQTAAEEATASKCQETPDVLITGSATKLTIAQPPQPDPHPQQHIDTNRSHPNQPVHPAWSHEPPVPNRRVAQETHNSHTCKDANGTPPNDDLPRPVDAGAGDSNRPGFGFGDASSHGYGSDMFLLPPESDMEEYPWPPPASMNMASSTSNNPYYIRHNGNDGHEQEKEIIQGPYFSATPKKPLPLHNRQDMLLSEQQAHSPRGSFVQPQMEPSFQNPFPTPTPTPTSKRKQQASTIEGATASKRTRKLCSPRPTTRLPPVPHQQRQPQHSFNFLQSSPLSSSSSAANATTGTATTTPTRRPRSRPWTGAMIADMAQTLQLSFPFANFSSKHGKAPSEVFEAFSAVVQMPLFEYSAKGMARARMKRFQERIRDYREKEKEIQRVHKREERRKEEGHETEKEKKKEKEKKEKEKEKEEKEKEMEKEKRGVVMICGNIRENPIVARGVGSSGGGGYATAAQNRNPTPRGQGQGHGGVTAAAAAGGNNSNQKSTMMPTMIPSSSSSSSRSQASGSTPPPPYTRAPAPSRTPRTTTTKTTTTASVPVPTPTTTTSSSSSSSTSNQPKQPNQHKKAPLIAPATTHNNTGGAPSGLKLGLELELRDGIYTLVE